MIFRDILKNIGDELSPEFDRLIKLAFSNQSHPGDLLLLSVNGFYDETILEWNKSQNNKLDPHVVGPGSEGFSERTHYEFIHKYRTTHIHQINHADYVNQFHMEKWDKGIRDTNDALIDKEGTTIQLEMLVYLKIWEADMTIKKLYQFVRILQGDHYDWHFKVSNSARDQGSTGSRQDIVRTKIRDPLQEISPILYDLIQNSYKTQIRNSIAHSNYSFLGRSIGLNNYIKNDPASQLNSITFDEWINIFHKTLVLHNECINLINAINKCYINLASNNNMTIPIRITKKDGTHYEALLEYREPNNIWSYKQLS